MNPINISEKRSLKKTVIEEIKAYIVEHQLKSGDKLPTERKFMEIFNVSRSVIREALSYLENTDVIRIRQGQGAFLNETNIESLLNNFFFLWEINNGKIQDILSLRIIFESSAIEEIIKNHSIEEINILKEITEESKLSKTPEEFRNADMLFHQQLLKATKNDLFIQMTNMITNYFFNVKHIRLTLEEYQLLINEHQEIVSAIESKNAHQAKTLLTEHLKKTKL